LMDINTKCLSMATRALYRRPVAVHGHRQDVLDVWRDLPEESVDSIDCMMVIHCLRGASLQDKLSFLAEAHRVLAQGGVFFGATLLAVGEGVEDNRFARLHIRIAHGCQNTYCNTVTSCT